MITVTQIKLLRKKITSGHMRIAGIAYFKRNINASKNPTVCPVISCSEVYGIFMGMQYFAIY